MTSATPRPTPPPGAPHPPAAARPKPAPPAGAPVRLTGAQSLVRSLEAVGCEVAFGIPGGAIMPAYDALLDSTKVRHVLVRHEQGAGHAATGYAQATGKVGVCMATSGPGATNLVTPLADAYMDSVPVVAITGQVAQPLIGTDGFQEADICGITMPITKHNFLVTDPAEIPRADRRGVPPGVHRPTRPGPGGHPEGRAAGDARRSSGRRRLRLPGYRPTTRPHGKQVREAAKLIARRTGRCSTSAAACSRPTLPRELLELAELTSIPVVTTLMARGAFPDSHQQHLGMPGMHGAVAAVAAMQRADLLIALGARFDDRVTGQLSSFAPDAKVVHADIDPAEISKNRHADVPIVGDCKEILGELIAAVKAERDAEPAADLTRGGRSSTAGARPSRWATSGPPTARCRRST